MDIISENKNVKTSDTADEITVRHSNKCKEKMPRLTGQHKERKYDELRKKLNLMLSAVAIKKRRNMTRFMAIADTGATGHFMMKNAPVINIQPAISPITITLPDGKTIKSTHTCNLNVPWLPATMTAGHIVPGMAHSSLISINKFCDGGCKVVYDENEVKVEYNGKIVLAGGRDKKTGLWCLPIEASCDTSTTSTDALNLQMTRQGKVRQAPHLAAATAYPYRTNNNS